LEGGRKYGDKVLLVAEPARGDPGVRREVEELG
jgi:hypothetical protein